MPGVVVIHEAWGLNDDIRGKADRLASEGYLALAPDLFERGLTVRCVVRCFRELRAGAGESFDDIAGARAHLVDHPRSNGKVGIIGFCMGGGFALMMAPRGMDVAAVNYGPLPADRGEVLKGSCPVVASYGGSDRSMRGFASRLEAILTELDVQHDVKEYPNAGHSFMNQQGRLMGPVLRVGGFGYCHDEAEDAWRRVLAMFAEALG